MTHALLMVDVLNVFIYGEHQKWNFQLSRERGGTINLGILRDSILIYNVHNAEALAFLQNLQSLTLASVAVSWPVWNLASSANIILTSARVSLSQRTWLEWNLPRKQSGKGFLTVLTLPSTTISSLSPDDFADVNAPRDRAHTANTTTALVYSGRVQRHGRKDA